MLASSGEGTAPARTRGVFMRTVLLRVTPAIAASAALVITHSPHQGGEGIRANGQIAFSRYDPGFGDDASYVMNPGGSNVRALFPSFAFNTRHADRRTAPRSRSLRSGHHLPGVILTGS